MMGEPIPEQDDLMQRACCGDAKAFDELVTRHREMVYLLAYHILRNEDDALDVAQDVFVKAWHAIGRFDGKASLGAWLKRITTNTAIDVFRRRTRRPQEEFESGPMKIDPASRTTPSQPAHPGDSIDRAEIGRRIREAFGQLSPEHRAVIVLKEMEDLSYDEIAKAVGCSIGTVMSRLFYARKRLQTLLGDVYEQL
jgi:RNA polymerase sigma-70 factor (ECF subfamily)